MFKSTENVSAETVFGKGDVAEVYLSVSDGDMLGCRKIFCILSPRWSAIGKNKTFCCAAVLSRGLFF